MSLSLNFVWACSKKNVQKLNYRNKKGLKNYRENNKPFLATGSRSNVSTDLQGKSGCFGGK